MKNINILDFLIPTLLEATGLNIEKLPQKIDAFAQEPKIGIQEIEKHKTKIIKRLMLLETISQFKKIILKIFPEESKTLLIKALLDRLSEAQSSSELRERISMILFCLFFSKGEDKVFDLNDPNFYDDEVCQKLFDQEIYIPENWLDQFIRCLNEKSAHEDMILHNFTPDWMWPKCFLMFIELYELTYEFQKNKIH